ncbi:MAG: phosphatidylglycerophosphatase A [Gammaproteobacteria bacterium]|nr:phosphatidylglycerophosphatase A [Gammaproteobacteria bacterium]
MTSKPEKGSKPLSDPSSAAASPTPEPAAETQRADDRPEPPGGDPEVVATGRGSDHPFAERAEYDPFLQLRPAHLRSPVQLLALGFGAGLAPRAPGTAGSLIAVPIAWLTLAWPLELRAAVVAALFVAGIWICGESARRLRTHDHPGIVFDEIVGLLATSLVLSGNPLWLIAAFFSFRLFDITKPWPIRDLDHRLAGGLGIMLDDLMAAVYAAAALVGLRYLLSLN